MDEGNLLYPHELKSHLKEDCNFKQLYYEQQIDYIRQFYNILDTYSIHGQARKQFEEKFIERINSNRDLVKLLDQVTESADFIDLLIKEREFRLAAIPPVFQVSGIEIKNLDRIKIDSGFFSGEQLYRVHFKYWSLLYDQPNPFIKEKKDNLYVDFTGAIHTVHAKERIRVAVKQHLGSPRDFTPDGIYAEILNPL